MILFPSYLLSIWCFSLRSLFWEQHEYQRLGVYDSHSVLGCNRVCICILVHVALIGGIKIITVTYAQRETVHQQGFLTFFVWLHLIKIEYQIRFSHLSQFGQRLIYQIKGLSSHSFWGTSFRWSFKSITLLHLPTHVSYQRTSQRVCVILKRKPTSLPFTTSTVPLDPVSPHKLPLKSERALTLICNYKEDYQMTKVLSSTSSD